MSLIWFLSRSSAGTRSALVGALAAGLVTGCATSPRVGRIDKMRDLYEQWPIELRQAVLDGKVEVGMNEDMVTAALGKPDEVTTRSGTSGGAEEMTWIYRPLREPDFGGSNGPARARMASNPMPIVDHNVVFRDGLVLRVDVIPVK